MKDKQLEDDPFYVKIGCRYLHRIQRLNSIAGDAFIGSRLTSQANQRAYQVSDLSCLRSPPAIHRHRMSFGQLMYLLMNGIVMNRLARRRQIHKWQLPKP